MKRIAGLLLALLCLLPLVGCAAQESEDSMIWMQALDELKQHSNYTVTENGLTSRYTPECAQVEQEDGIVYYSLQEDQCLIWVHNDDPDVWIRTEIPSSDNFFYAYELIERLNKLGGYIDMGLLHYDQETQSFRGEQLGQPYVYRGEAHAPESLEVLLEDGVIIAIRETRMGTDDTGAPALITDEVRFDDFYITQVHLPLNVVDYSEGSDEYGSQDPEG